jgi:ribosomal protein L1
LIDSVKSSIESSIGGAIGSQRDALTQLDNPIGKANQLAVDLVHQLESLKASLDQQSSDRAKRNFWGQGGQS